MPVNDGKMLNRVPVKVRVVADAGLRLDGERPADESLFVVGLWMQAQLHERLGGGRVVGVAGGVFDPEPHGCSYSMNGVSFVAGWTRA